MEYPIKQIFEYFIKPDNILTFVAIATSIVTFVFLVKTLRQTNKITKCETYQRLELASIDLFQFEIEQSAKTYRLYDVNHNIKSPPIDGETIEIREMMNHVTQMLNLFEMSIELHKKKIFDDKVFATWVKWIYEIAQLKNFIRLWKDETLGQNLNRHYTLELCCLVTIAENRNFEEFVECLCYKEKFEGFKLFLNKAFLLKGDKHKSCINQKNRFDCYKRLKRYRKLKKYLHRFCEQNEQHSTKRCYNESQS